jgi:hypothetical protein
MADQLAVKTEPWGELPWGPGLDTESRRALDLKDGTDASVGKLEEPISQAIT